MKTKPITIVAEVFGVIFRVVLIVAIVYAIYQAAEVAYDYGYRIFAEEPVAQGEGQVITVTITSEMKPKEIGALLESKGLIRDGKLFIVQYYLSEFVKDVRPGTFELSTAMTVEEMMETMAQKKNTEEGDS